MATVEQIKAARELLKWTQKDLSNHIGDSSYLPAIRKFESGATKNPRDGLLDKIIDTLETNNIIFTPTGGVDLSQNNVRIIDKGHVFLKILDDVYHTLSNDNNGELLYFFADNSKSPESVIDAELRLRKQGIKMRSLVSEQDRYFIYPLNEYRQVPSMFFKNQVQLVYGDKFANFYSSGKTKDGKPQYRAVILRDEETASAERNKFNLIWSMCNQPKETIAETTYD